MESIKLFYSYVLVTIFLFIWSLTQFSYDDTYIYAIIETYTSLKFT